VLGNKLRNPSSSPQSRRYTAECAVSAYLTQTYLTHVGHYFVLSDSCRQPLSVGSRNSEGRLSASRRKIFREPSLNMASKNQLKAKWNKVTVELPTVTRNVLSEVVVRVVSCHVGEVVVRVVSCHVSEVVMRVVSCHVIEVVMRVVSCHVSEVVMRVFSCHVSEVVVRVVSCHVSEVTIRVVSCHVSEAVMRVVSCHVSEVVMRVVRCHASEVVMRVVT